jgi:hypothetical protein
VSIILVVKGRESSQVLRDCGANVASLSLAPTRDNWPGHLRVLMALNVRICIIWRPTISQSNFKNFDCDQSSLVYDLPAQISLRQLCVPG